MNIVISGVSRGIGKAIALVCLKNGHKVIGCSISKENIEKITNELKQLELLANFHGSIADLSKRDEVVQFVNFIAEKVSHVDVLINNAGVFIPGSIIEENDDTLLQLLNTNLMSAYYLSKALMPNFIQHQAGLIINICSVAALHGYPSGGSYAISKHALLGFSRSLREELKTKNIKVTAIHPGATLTDSWNGVDLPKERFIPTDDIAALVYSIMQLSKNSVIEEVIIRPQLGDI